MKCECLVEVDDVDMGFTPPKITYLIVYCPTHSAAESMRKALHSIVYGTFHIGNDERGNLYGPPDGVMCRNIAAEAIAKAEGK
jgi:hypothetical protein